MLKLATSEKVSLTVKEKLESYLLDCIERIDSSAIDLFLVKNSNDNFTYLTSLMEFSESRSFIKLIQKASPLALRMALLKSIQKSTELFSFSFALLSKTSRDVLMEKLDSDTKKYVLESLQSIPQQLKHLLPIQQELAQNKIALSPANNASQGEKNLTELLAEIKNNNEENSAIAELLVNDELKKQCELIHQKYKNPSSLHADQKSISEWNAEDCQTWTKKIKRDPNKASDPQFLPEIIAVIMQAVKIHSGYIPRNTQILSLLLFLNTKNTGRLAQIATGEGKSIIVAMLAMMKVLQGHKVDVVTSSAVLAIRDSESKKTLFDLFDITVAHNEDDKTTDPKACYKADIVYGTALSFQGDLLRDEYYVHGTRNQRLYDVVICDEVDSMLVDNFSHHCQLLMPKSGMEHLQLLLTAIWQELARIEQETRDEITQTAILKEYVKKLITDAASPIYIPAHLKEFALYQADFWIKSAINARYHFVEGIDYIIAENENGDDVVAPVDYANTGVVQNNSVWTNGTHQFLHIRHQLKLKPESLSPCFISNLAFFNRYGKNIYGLTGTLGTSATQELLQYTYPVDLVFVPTFKGKQFIEIPGTVAESEDSWLKAVAQSVQMKINNKQAVLIICETIRAVRQVDAVLQTTLDPKASCIKHYTRTDNDEKNVVAQVVDAGHVIIATNLAGRGTDIQTSSTVEKNGGLHVCLTFLPRNKRVEDQALGRTARSGNQGTGQLIINEKNDVVHTMKHCKTKRDEKEIFRLQEIKNIEIAKIKLRDNLFSRFCLLMKQLRALDNNENKLSEIEDRWVFWLKKWSDRLTNEDVVDSSIILADFEQFKQAMEKTYAQNDFANPCHLICNANESEDQEKAIADYTKAIQLDSSIISVQAYYNRAFSHLKKKNQENALNDLAVAKLMLEEQLIPQLQAMQVIVSLSPDQASSQSAFNKQIQNKIDLYRRQIKHIDQVIQAIQNANPDNELIVEGDFEQLHEIYKELHIPAHDMVEMYQSGLRQFFAIKEVSKKGDSLWGALGVAILGVIQIIVGVVVSLAGGAYIGQVLISEGIGDILYAVRSVIDGHFSWKDYQATKTTSIAISIITAGIDVIKANQYGVTKKAIDPKAFIEAAKQKVTQVVVAAGVKEAVNLGVNHLSHQALKNFKSDIHDHIKKTFLRYFNQDDARIAIDKLIFSDCTNQNLHYTNELKQLVLSSLYSSQRTKDISENILRGVIANQSKDLSTILKLADIGCALDDIAQFTKNVCEDLSYAVKLLGHSLPLAAQNQSATRNILYDAIIDMITNAFMSVLHGQVIRPITNSVVSRTVDSLADKMQRVGYAAQFVEDKEDKKDDKKSISFSNNVELITSEKEPFSRRSVLIVDSQRRSMDAWPFLFSSPLNIASTQEQEELSKKQLNFSFTMKTSSSTYSARYIKDKNGKTKWMQTSRDINKNIHSRKKDLSIKKNTGIRSSPFKSSREAGKNKVGKFDFPKINMSLGPETLFYQAQGKFLGVDYEARSGAYAHGKLGKDGVEYSGAIYMQAHAYKELFRTDNLLLEGRLGSEVYAENSILARIDSKIKLRANFILLEGKLNLQLSNLSIGDLKCKVNVGGAVGFLETGIDLGIGFESMKNGKRVPIFDVKRPAWFRFKFNSKGECYNTLFPSHEVTEPELIKNVYREINQRMKKRFIRK